MATMWCTWDGYDYEWEHVVDDFGHDNDDSESGFIELKKISLIILKTLMKDVNAFWLQRKRCCVTLLKWKIMKL